MMKCLPATTGSVELSDWGRTGVATTGSLSSYKGGTLGVAKTRVLGEEKEESDEEKDENISFLPEVGAVQRRRRRGCRPREREKKVFFFFFYSSAPPGPNMAFYIPSSRSVGLLLFFSKRNKKNIADIAPYIELYYSHFKNY